MNVIHHHAYVIEGRVEVLQEEVERFIENELDVSTTGNPDFWMHHFNKFGVDDARTLSRLQTRKGFGGSKKVFMVSFNTTTSEAQNALLKVFEEPTLDTHFFVIVPTLELLLPTVRSRMEVLDLKEEKTSTGAVADEFLRLGATKRLVFVADIIEEKNISKARDLINDLEVYIHTHTNVQESVFVFEELQRARIHLNTRSPSLKLILEHLALIIPKW